MAFNVGPFQQVVAYEVPPEPGTEEPYNGPWWRIAKNLYRSDLDVNYVGEGDGVTASTFSTRAWQIFETTDIYEDFFEAQSAITALNFTDPFGRSLYRLDQDTEGTLDPTTLPLSDPLWIDISFKTSGFLPYTWKAGRKPGEFGGFVNDIECPPEDFTVTGASASEAHALNYRDWQQSLTGGISGSWTLNFTATFGGGDTDLYCIPGVE
jgi:hypothetical protein